MQIFGKTDIGRMRDVNEDSYFTYINGMLAFLVVCDGMGGHNAGNIASNLTCNIISNQLKKATEYMTGEQIKNLIVTAISEANTTVFAKAGSNEQYLGMGTTTVVALINGNKAYIAHVGDSRVYIYRNNTLQRLTKDHSVVQELFEQGKISEGELKTHPERNKITRAIGVHMLVDIDYIEVNKYDEMMLLLCTDGLTNLCSDALIEETIRNTPVCDLCDTLVKMSNNAGGFDNVTVAIAL